MYIVIYRRHNQLNVDTQYIGPFMTEERAYDALCELPALGIYKEDGQLNNPGVKFTQALQAPTRFKS